MGDRGHYLGYVRREIPSMNLDLRTGFRDKEILTILMTYCESGEALN
jgi:hypothetical protein